mmetsp:Transcript_43907/g.106472  ORF Transcript_43907/g.106472 Transcript_43907/m.106472 type:complete len:88 (-) Transcript_43907:2577-2840(-)
MHTKSLSYQRKQKKRLDVEVSDLTSSVTKTRTDRETERRSKNKHAHGNKTTGSTSQLPINLIEETKTIDHRTYHRFASIYRLMDGVV